jgi:uncharacterized protein (TIGR03118 family)
VLVLAGVLAFSAPAAAEQGYLQHNLVSDVAGLADRTDPNLVNPWGIVHGGTSPWWINANGTGLSLVYDGSGLAFPTPKPLVVTVPPPGATGTSAPTGIVFNGTTDFQVAPGMAARFIFATEDGTISGWNAAVDPLHAILKVNHSPGAVYKGLAIGSIAGQNVLYAANFRGGSVDVFDGNFNPVGLPSGAFMDALAPPGYAPFNVAVIGGNVFVAFAQQDATKHDDVAGVGSGYVAVFDPHGTLLMRLQHGRWLNSPWAIVQAPASFGRLGGRILVGNFGSGQIAAFDPVTGEFEGLLRDRRGKPVMIEGLWGLDFGNGATAGPAGTLYFSAGIQGEAHGLFGTLTAIKTKTGGDDGEDEDDDSDDAGHDDGQ